MKQQFNKLLTLAICSVFTIWGLYLRILQRHHRPLWKDEENQLTQTLGPWKPFWLKNGFDDMTFFPGDYQLTYLFVHFFSPNKWAVVIPHIILTVVGFYLLYKVCQLYFKSPVGYLVTYAVFCFNATLIFHAFELRAYAVLPTMALAVFYITYKIFNHYDDLSTNKKIGFAAVLLLCIWFNLSGMLMVLLSTIYFAVMQNKEKLKKPLLYLLKVVLISLPLWLFYAIGDQPQFTFEGNILGGRHTFQFIKNPLEYPVAFLKSIFGNLVGKKPLYFLLAGLIASFVIPTRDHFKQLGFFLILIILPIEMTLMAAANQGYWFLQRQFVWTMPLFALLLGWSWDTLYCYVKEKVRWPLYHRKEESYAK